MNRIDTASISAYGLLDIQKAQAELHALSRQSASQTRADNVRDYGHDTQWLVSSQSLLARIEARRDQAGLLKNRLELQDLSLDHASSALRQLKDTALEALALNTGDGLLPALEETLSELTSALNLRHNGQYVFAGILHDQPPLKAQNLEDLLAGTVEDALLSPTRPQKMRLDGAETDMAPQGANIARAALEIIHTLGNFDQSPDGPFGHPLSETQQTAIKDQLTALDTAFDTLLTAQTDNGRLLKRVEEAEIRLGTEHDTLGQVIGERTSIDLAELAARLSEAQISYQASASIFNSLRGLTLLDIL